MIYTIFRHKDIPWSICGLRLAGHCWQVALTPPGTSERGLQQNGLQAVEHPGVFGVPISKANMAQLFQLLSKLPSAAHFYLEQSVFPQCAAPFYMEVLGPQKRLFLDGFDGRL